MGPQLRSWIIVLRDGDSTLLCERLTDRGIPFVIYSGFNKVEGACKAGTLVRKPATGEALVATVEGLLPSEPDPICASRDQSLTPRQSQSE